MTPQSFCEVGRQGEEEDLVWIRVRGTMLWRSAEWAYDNYNLGIIDKKTFEFREDLVVCYRENKLFWSNKGSCFLKRLSDEDSRDKFLLCIGRSS